MLNLNIPLKLCNMKIQLEEQKQCESMNHLSNMGSQICILKLNYELYIQHVLFWYYYYWILDTNLSLPSLWSLNLTMFYKSQGTLVTKNSSRKLRSDKGNKFEEMYYNMWQEIFDFCLQIRGICEALPIWNI